MRKRLLIVYHTQIDRKEVTAADLTACEELGEAMASGVALGIF